MYSVLLLLLFVSLFVHSLCVYVPSYVYIYLSSHVMFDSN